MSMLWRSMALGAGLLTASAGLSAQAGGDGGWGFDNGIKRVLLISIDGMHALDSAYWACKTRQRRHCRWSL
jgi:hypothetical protein